jgi:hypothetical protein
MAIIYFAINPSGPSATGWSELGDIRLNRRRWLAWAVASGMLASYPVLGANLPSSTALPDVTKVSMPALDAVVDTLVPADDRTPSASALGVARIILEQAKGDASFRPWLIEGMTWLDQGTPGSFVQLDEPARHLLVGRLAASAPGSQMRTFFELLRIRTMTAYYADPRGRTGLAIARPPQPLGYPDFAGKK